MRKPIIFAGCSFTWGQGLWSYCPTKQNVPTVDDYLNGHPIPHDAQQFRESNRWAQLVSRHYENFEPIIKRHNGGTDEESIKFIDEVKRNHVNQHTLLTQNVEWNDVELCVFQTTQIYRSSFYFNHGGKDYRVFSEPNRRNFDRLEHIEYLKNPDGIVNTYEPNILKETKDFNIFYDWLIDNKISVEDFQKTHCNTMFNKIKNKLKELEEKYNIPTLIISWTDEYLKEILNDEWASKRFVKINHNGKEYECIEYLFEKNPEMEIAHDPSVLHKSGIDGHPSLVCHRHIASSIINKITTDKLLNGKRNI